LFDIAIKECTNLDSITKLFEEHRGDPFTYLGDIHLFKLFSRLKFFKPFEAEVDGQVVGCIYAMRYMYDYGWLGGLFVHKRFRRMGVGRALLERELQFLGSKYAYLFVYPENVVARRLFENVGFNAVYRRLNYVSSVPLDESIGKCKDISYDVEWDELTAALGFKERGGVVSLGYYPIKVTKHVFEDLKNKRKILKCGSVLAIVENSYSININSDTFTFNDHVLKGLSVHPSEKIVEVNPFYAKAQTVDLIKLINSLAVHGKVTIYTYQEDPVARSLPLKGALGALVMELSSEKATFNLF